MTTYNVETQLRSIHMLREAIDENEDPPKIAESWWDKEARDEEANNWRDRHEVALAAVRHSKSWIYSSSIMELAVSLAQGEEVSHKPDPADKRLIIRSLGRLMADIGPPENNLGSLQPIHFLVSLLFSRWAYCAFGASLKTNRAVGGDNYQKILFEEVPHKNFWVDRILYQACAHNTQTKKNGRMKSWNMAKKDLELFLDTWEHSIAKNVGKQSTKQVTFQQTSTGLCCMALRCGSLESPRRVSPKLASRILNLEGWLGPGPHEVDHGLISIQQAAWDRHLLERWQRALRKNEPVDNTFRSPKRRI